MRVLFLAYYFPPIGGMGSIRAVGFARHLPSFGVEVAVVAPCRGTYPPDRSLEVPRDLVVSRTGTLEPSVLLRRRRGGVGDGGGASARPGLLRKLLYVPDGNNGWIPFGVRASLALASRWRPDVVLASAPPLSALLAGSLVARRLRVPFVPDCRDFFATQRLFPGMRARIDERLERMVLDGAAGFVAATEGVRDDIRGRADRPSLVVPNGYDEEDFAGPAPPPGRPLTLVHVGSSYADRRHPGALLRALAALRREGLDLRLRLVGGNDPALAGAAGECGLSGALEVVSFTGHRQAVEEMRKAWALLLYVWAGDPVVAAGVRAGKTLELLRSGRPVLFLGPLDGENARLVRETGGAVLVDDGDEAGIREGLASFAAGRFPAPADPARLAPHSRREGARRLAIWLAELIGSAR